MKSPVHITRNPHHPVLLSSSFQWKVNIDSEFNVNVSLMLYTQ